MVDYEKPVRVKVLRLATACRIPVSRNPSGTWNFDTSATFIDAVTKQYAIEIHLRMGLARIWSTIAPDSPVTIVKLGGGESWDDGEVANPSPKPAEKPEPKRAA